MTQFTFTRREFIQDPAAAKHTATKGPVYITERGRPSHVILSIDQYYDLIGTGQNIVDALAMPEDAADFEPEIFIKTLGK